MHRLTSSEALAILSMFLFSFSSSSSTIKGQRTRRLRQPIKALSSLIGFRFLIFIDRCLIYLFSERNRLASSHVSHALDSPLLAVAWNILSIRQSPTWHSPIANTTSGAPSVTSISIIDPSLYLYVCIVVLALKTRTSQ